MANTFVNAMRIEPGSAPKLDERDPGPGRRGLRKRTALRSSPSSPSGSSVLHNRLWAEATRSVLLVLQGLDASGKDGTIRHVLTGVNPQGCRIVSFKVPTATELAHDYLWRVHAACPARGEIGIFNRSHYEDVVAVRVRGLAPRRSGAALPSTSASSSGCSSTRARPSSRSSSTSRRTSSGKRLQERLDDPEKRWKFRLGDLDDRARWDDYIAAYEDAIRETSTDWAPWYVVPADHNWVRNLVGRRLLVETLERLDPKLPPPDPKLDGLKVT